MKFIKKIDDIYTRDYIPVIYMAEAIIKTKLPWHIRTWRWCRRRVPLSRKEKPSRIRKAYDISRINRVFRTRTLRPLPGQLISGRSQLWSRLYERYHRVLNEVRANLKAPENLFQSRLLEGLSRLILRSPALLRSGFDEQLALICYQYGELRESRSFFEPPTFDATEIFLLGQNHIDLLTRGENLKHFACALNFVFSKSKKEHEAEIERLKTDQRFSASIKFLNLSIQVTFENQRIAAVEIKAAHARQDKAALDKLREERFEARAKALGSMIDYGYVIEAATAAVSSRNGYKIAAFILSKKNIAVAKAVFRASPIESLSALIETAVDLTAKREGKDVVEKAVLFAANVARSRADLLPSMVKELKNAYHNSFIKGAQQAADQARVDVLSQILENTPAVIPSLLNEYNDSYSRAKIFFAPILAVFGIRIGDISTTIIKPIILRATQGLTGKNAILSHAYHTAVNILSFNLAKGKLGRTLAMLAVRSALNYQSSKAPVFAQKERSAELREIIHTLANTSEFNRDEVSLTEREARALLFVASKIQAVIELLRKGEPAQALIVFNELDKISSSYEIASVKIPFFDSLAQYIQGKNAKSFGETYFIKADPFTEYLIANACRGNIISAQGVIDVLKRGDHPIWKYIPSPINEAAHRSDPDYGLALVTFYTRYAYCFLTATWMQGGNPEHRIRDLNSTLSGDTDHKQLFLTLQSIPPVIKKEQLRNFVRLVEEAGHPELAARILAEHG